MFLCNLWQLGKGSLVPVKYTVDMNTGMPEKILGASVLTLEKYDFICSCFYGFFFFFFFLISLSIMSIFTSIFQSLFAFTIPYTFSEIMKALVFIENPSMVFKILINTN